MPHPAGEGGDLSVVIPAYNEATRIRGTLESLCTYLATWPGRSEIVLVDDGSLDGTAELARKILGGSPVSHRVLTGRANRGKGYTVREGALAARHPWTLISDADLSTPIEEVERLFAAARRDGLDLVAGSRGLPESRIGVQQAWVRRNMGRTFNRIVRLVTGLSMRDTQCGFKLWRTERLRPIFEKLTVDGFAWDVEMLIAARRAGLPMREIPVQWNNAPGSKVSIMTDALHMLWDVVRVRLRQ